MVDYFNHSLLKKNRIERRLYQETLLAKCVTQNSLIILPTGLGKTIIAILMAVMRLNKFPNSQVIFLAPTKPLVEQHKKTFEEVINIDPSKLVVLTGSISPENREEFYQNASIIFITPQTLQNDLLRGKSLINVSLMVFDEAHRAIGDYAYPFIAKQYISTAERPLILGITASPGSEEEKIREIIQNLFIEHIEIRTDTSADVKEYIQETKFEKYYIDLPEKFEKLRNLIKDELKNALKLLKENKLINSIVLENVNQKDLLQVQSILRNKIKSDYVEPIIWELIKVTSISIKLSHMLNLIETQGLSSFKDYLKKIEMGKTKSDLMIINSPFFEEIKALANSLLEEEIEHPKLKLLKNIIDKQFQEHKDSRIMVFVHYRNSAKKVTEILESSKLIRPIRFVGQASRRNDKGLKQKEQIEIIQQFKDGLYNVLIATSVAEEGLDISEVDLVIFYDTVPSSIRSIQRRGRTGRKRAGRVVILMAKGTKDEGYFWVSKRKETRMKKNLENIQKITQSINKEKAKSKIKSLDSFITDKKTELLKVKDGNEITIIIDSRETASSVARELKNLNCMLEIQQLTVGDYIVSDRVAIERKSNDDFVQSIIDGRIWEELMNLSSNYTTPILILEGDPPQTNKRLHINAILGALSTILIKFKLPTIYSRNEADTAAIILALAKKEQLEQKRSIRIRYEKAATEKSQILERVIAGIPGIDLKRSRSILTHFGTLNNIFKQKKVDEFIKIEGIGKKIAEEIIDISQHEYEPNEDVDNG
ncbi:MAG: DEAD/DEAH box helicase [Candidatus Lokiarchaeota archaeon]|nr:DEAD/DEAH box helicase [Candidatus Lokiarchaeota archaeon]